MNKRYRRPVWAVVLCSLFAVSCDSGDIFEKDKTADGGVAVRGTFELLNPEVFPQQYDLIFGVFAADGTSALSSVNVLKPADGEKVQLSIDNVPDEARSVRFSLINSGRQVVHTFFEYDLDDDRTSDVDLPAVQIDLLEYDRIQRMVFQQYNCISCHQGTSGAGGLLLTEGDSYRSLVGVPATHSNKPRVEPSDPDGSFLLDVLTAEGAVAYPHTGLVTRSEDINLLRVWIEKGCPQN